MKLPQFKFFKDKSIWWIILIFCVVLALRLYISFQTPLFNYDAYFNLRQAEHIRETGLPLYNDPLSYGGKTQLFAPLNSYILAAFSLVMPLATAAKIVPNIIAAMLVFMIYYLAFKITKNNKASIITAFMSGFMPIYFIDLNRVSVNYLAILLVFSIIYCMLKLADRKFVDYTLILMFLLVLTTPMAFILVIGLLLYLLLLKLENLPVEMKELEIILFFTFLVFWVNLLLYKNAFLTHGLLVIWQNTPLQLLSASFSSLGFIQLIWAISIVPLILGVYASYAAFHFDHMKDLVLVISVGLSAFILLWFKLLDLASGLIFLGMILVVLTAYSLKRLDEFISKSKVHKYSGWVYTTIVVLFIISIIPAAISLSNNPRIGPLSVPDTSDVHALEWAKENLPKNAVIATSLNEGSMTAYYSERKNIMDTNFLLTPRIDQRLLDINELYTTTFETKAVGIMNKYDSKYILITPSTLEQYNINELAYIKDNKCFQLIYYREGTYLYRLECKVE